MRRVLNRLDNRTAAVVRPVEIVLGVLTFAGVVGIVLGSDGVELVAAAVVAMCVTGLVVVVINERTTSSMRHKADQDLLHEYSSELHKQMDSAFRLAKWEQRTVIDKNGDTRQMIAASAIVVKSPGLRLYRLKIGAGWDQPERYRRQVEVHLDSAEVENVEDRHARLTTRWLPGGKLEVYVHFSRPMARGRRFRVVAVLDWPGKCSPLMVDRVPDEFRYLASRFLDELAYIVVLPPGADVTLDSLGFEPDEENYSLSTTRNAAGQLEIELRAVNIKPPRVVGMRLDLK